MSDVCTITASGRSYLIENPGGRVGSKVEHGEPYERKLLVDIAQHKPTGVAFDVGAHVGNHSLYLAGIVGLKVHAFECHAATVAMLHRNVALNPGLDITVHPLALGAAPGRGRLTSGRWIEFDPTRDDVGHVEAGEGDIEVVRVDDLLDEPDLSIVKVDVEGTEPQVLQGMVRHLSRSHPIVYTESHSPEAHAEVAEVLEPLGYRMTRGIHMGSTMERWEAR